MGTKSVEFVGTMEKHIPLVQNMGSIVGSSHDTAVDHIHELPEIMGFTLKIHRWRILKIVNHNKSLKQNGLFQFDHRIFFHVTGSHINSFNKCFFDYSIISDKS